MTLEHPVSQVLIHERGPDWPEPAETPALKAGARPLKVLQRLRRFRLWLFFGAGLLVGWLAIGWWLWPVEWTNSAPWELYPEAQRTFVGLVAENYWRTADISQAERDLAGWDRTELSNLLAAMQGETSDPETRQHLATLAKALQLPGSETSLSASLLNQPIFLVGIFLSAAPLLVAVALIAAPLVRKRGPSAVELLAQAEQAELLPGLQTEEPLMLRPEEETAEGRKGQEAEPEDTGDKEAAELEEEQPSDLRDLISLFEEEDTSLSALEALCKGLPEIGIAELSAGSREVVHRLRAANAHPADSGRPG